MGSVRARWGIDCIVTFPSSSSRDSPGEIAASSAEVRDPVVVLLGWAGCKDRNLAKYAAIYEKQYITIRYIAPTEDLFFKIGNLRQAADKILELVVDLDLKTNPIFVHSFSNGGGSIYRWISEIIHHKPEYKRMRLAGAIFDSSPGKRNIFRGAKVLLMTLSYPLTVKYFILILFLFYSFFLHCLSAILRLLLPHSVASDYWSAIKKDPSTCPQLYLYSKADELISYLDIEEHINARRSQNITVRIICWPDSPHVAHLLKYHELYVKSCKDFIEFCLSCFKKQS